MGSTSGKRTLFLPAKTLAASPAGAIVAAVPDATSASAAVKAFVSITGMGCAPTVSNASSINARLRMSFDNRHNGNLAASAHVIWAA